MKPDLSPAAQIVREWKKRKEAELERLENMLLNRDALDLAQQYVILRAQTVVRS